MIDHEQIYRSQADRYDLLVSREDCHGQILPALRKIRELKGLDVAELGAGSGRLTAQIAPLAKSVRAFDGSAHMLEYAARKLEKLEISNTILQEADNRKLPLENSCVDLALSGWSIGYFASPKNPDWRQDVVQALAEMRRILRPDGTIVILETLGTGYEEPRVPTAELEAYYTYLEEKEGFERTWIRTDYRFASVEEALRTIEFFFGEPLSSRVREQKLTVIPECTGIWWRRI
ncbi:MAG: class I SAM-dependent methyltransferase [Spirochaetaceae bacterium]|nr:MAG: class I SAM-dependent methyltransferase [Spirochaetaceae bacterium]